MSLQLDRLNYVLQTKTISQASKESGIPYTTLYYFSKGVRDLPRIYNTNLLSEYGSTVYYNFRDIGTNSVQANRFRFSNPEVVNQMQSELLEKLSFYAHGTNVMIISKWDYIPSYAEYDSLYLKSYAAQQKGLHDTKRSLEDWTTYLG